MKTYIKYANNKVYNLLFLLMGITMVMSSCKTEKLTPDYTESVKDIAGTWKVVNATVNGNDIIKNIPDNMTQISAFNISFKDGKYALKGLVPFIVSLDGSYTLSDPQYPTDITFAPNGGKAITTAFTYPITQGQRQLQLTFSPGCSSNTYIYTLSKIN
ncbi:DUF5004 domain-containing protein [Mucilaginibacter sp. CSA2-8R]|uniref:DUF5004 domain-containing protein n=1 Tax=Mucilaginibacter sp. CSA2-8R TaxID=3141542 RepID=UPI00315CD584